MIKEDRPPRNMGMTIKLASLVVIWLIALIYAAACCAVAYGVIEVAKYMANYHA